MSSWLLQAGGRDQALESLAAKLTRGRVRGKTARGACPCCGNSTGAWAQIDDGGLPRAGCFACNDWRAVQAALGIDEAGEGEASTASAPRTPKVDPAPDMVADADALHAVYEVLARHLPMSGDQRRNVLGRDRGLPLAVRDRMAALVGPIPRDPGTWAHRRGLIVEDLRRVAPIEFLRRVPELAPRRGDGLAVLPTRRNAQYFEPWRDERGRVVALRAYMGKRSEPKYLTSPGRTGPLVHFAFGVPPAAVPTAPWIFTEAWMKAEVAAHHLGAVGVAFAGVNQPRAWPRALEALHRLAPEAPTYVAFDAEVWTTRLDLTIPTLHLARDIERVTGRPAGFAVWDTTVGEDGKVSPKGIDDAIAAGAYVRLVERETFGSYLRPALDAWEQARAA